MPTNKTTKKEKPRKLTAERASSTSTTKGMTDRAKLIGQLAPKSTIWQGNGTISKSGQDAIDAGAAVEKDETDIQQLETQIAAARNKKAKDEVNCASKLNVYFTNVEDVVTDPKEMQELAVDPLQEHEYGIVAPLAVAAKSDPLLHDISVRVKRAPGLGRCQIEVSLDATFATGVQRFPGDGARQKMGPFPAGTYSVRACHVRAAERSDYCEAATIVVK